MIEWNVVGFEDTLFRSRMVLWCCWVCSLFCTMRGGCWLVSRDRPVAVSGFPSLARAEEPVNFVPKWIQSFLRRVGLNPRLLGYRAWRYFFLGILDDGHGDWMQAGRGDKSGDLCGIISGHSSCHEVQNHGHVYNGHDYTNESVFMRRAFWCKRAVCPTCFLSGYCVSEAQVISARLGTAADRTGGVVDHIVFSPPKELRGLSPVVLWERFLEVAADRGVLGGVGIFHGRRIDDVLNKLVWSPHIHTEAFVAGGFDVCRNCVHERGDCEKCSCFKGRQVRGYAKDGWIVKVQKKRESKDGRDPIFGTAFYILSHISIKVGVKKVCSVRWFGNCANRKFKSRKPETVVRCPVCKMHNVVSEMHKEAYWGHEDCKSVADVSFTQFFGVPDFDEKGCPNFPSAVREDEGG